MGNISFNCNSPTKQPQFNHFETIDASNLRNSNTFQIQQNYLQNSIPSCYESLKVDCLYYDAKKDLFNDTMDFNRYGNHKRVKSANNAGNRQKKDKKGLDFMFDLN